MAGVLKKGVLVGGITLLLLELVLQIYNPMPFSIDKGQVKLRAHAHVETTNTLNPKLYDRITLTTNSLGFRGPEPPSELSSINSIICVGGSTTFCYYNPDSLTWPFLLQRTLKKELDNVWVNNAGLNGHSTFGHLAMMKQYINELQPKYALFLVGVNDMSADQANKFDLFEDAPDLGPLSRLMNKSEVIGLLKNLYRVRKAQQVGINHYVDFDLATWPHTEVVDSIAERTVQAHSNKWLPGYQKRIEQLIAECKTHNITPIFMTQPALFGDTVDPVTGVNLGTTAMRYGNGKVRWELLKAYNKTLINTCATSGVKVIDLGELLEKNSLYYYDFVHFTRQGNKRIVELIAPELTQLMTAP